MTYVEAYSYIDIKSCPSTNDYVKDNLKLLKDNLPLIVSSREQSKGKGRDKRAWESQKDKGLYFTLAFYLEDLQKLSLLPICAGVSLQKTLENLYGLTTTLKWPNDLLCQGKKLAGILCETIIKGNSAFVICGIGLNTEYKKRDFPLELKETAISLLQLKVKNFKKKDFFNLFTKIFEQKLYKQDKLIDEFNQCSKELIGKKISFHNGNNISQKTITGTYLGLGEKGQCLIKDEKGNIQEYFFGEMTC